jgi:hypothetical protein
MMPLTGSRVIHALAALDMSPDDTTRVPVSAVCRHMCRHGAPATPLLTTPLATQRCECGPRPGPARFQQRACVFEKSACKRGRP